MTDPPVSEAVERVLLAVTLIPPGRVASYGAIAAITGTTPRQVGRIMHDHGGAVPWWRVTSHDGDLPAPLLEDALPRWDEEGIRVKPNGRGCRMAEFGADLDDLDAAFRSEARRRHH